MKRNTDANYSSNVFINCPFDETYKPLFNVIIFTIHACGFIPRSALEYDDSDDVRIQKINKIIEDCQYGIHDVSLAEPRFNMPLELGIFIGCKQFGPPKQQKKKYLILEKELHQSKKYISDLSGQDVKAHKNDERELMRCVRDWLSNKRQGKIPHTPALMQKFESFIALLPQLCESEDWAESELTFNEYSSLVLSWLEAQKSG
jgi:hypothetical protein